jgi:hypothetical protein
MSNLGGSQCSLAVQGAGGEEGEVAGFIVKTF